MNRTVAWSLAFCLCWCAEQASAQGLLGKPSLSSQYLSLWIGDELDTKVGNGGRIQGNFPLMIPSDDSAWASRIDVTGSFSGIGLDLRDPSIPGFEMNMKLLGGDLGLNFFARATENIRPFVQLGMNWRQADLKATTPGFAFRQKDSDTNLILTGGVEVDVFPVDVFPAVFPAVALRGSYGRGADGYGGTAFLGEVILRPGDHWFGRFSASVDSDKTVIGGFGAGYAW